MHTDTAFTIGSTHEICQDYAASNHNAVVLCDGCSSSKNTDVGARILAIKAARLLEISAGHQFTRDSLRSLYVQALCESIPIVNDLGLHQTCLDVTILIANVQENKLIASIFGDGAVAFGGKDGIVKVHSINYAKSFPFYPNYLASVDRLDLWNAEKENQKVITTYAIENGVSTQEVTSYSELEFEFFELEIEDYNFVVLTSDGASSFVDKTNNQLVPQSEVMSRLTAFKNFNGQFVHRKLSAFMKRDAVQNNWSNYDDVSLAGIRLGEE